MLLVFSEHTTARLLYILDVLFDQLSGVDVRITNDREEFKKSESARLNYSHTRITEKEIWICPNGLLFEKEIKSVEVSCKWVNNYATLFTNEEGDINFDLLSASFYLLTRYEEYLPHESDEYGRYAHANSIAYRENFLQQPVVEYWLLDLKRNLQILFPSLIYKAPNFRFLPTYDIDIAYSYRGKGWKRNTGGWIKSILQGDFSAASQRVKVLKGKEMDPYDVYERLYATHLRYALKPVYFFLLADEQKGYDKNIHPKEKVLQELVNYHAEGYKLGIHPSWQSHDRPELLEKEIHTLEEITGKPVSRSRQHYLRLSLPVTYRRLLDMGISKDFSMGYGTINGFRASISSPFTWYDLEKEEATDLLLIPFCFMDANAFYEEQMTPSAAYEQLKRYHDTIKKVHGQMVTIFHNNFLGTDPAFKGWREVYELFLSEVLYWDVW